MKKLKVYVGCSLTHAPEDFKREVQNLKALLRELPGVEVLEFLGLKKGDCRDVYIHDIVDCVSKCDLMIAICDYPSIGLGWEMGTQTEQRHKPLLAVAHETAKVTRLIQDPKVEGYSFRRYRDLCLDVFEMARSMIQDLLPRSEPTT